MGNPSQLVDQQPLPFQQLVDVDGPFDDEIETMFDLALATEGDVFRIFDDSRGVPDIGDCFRAEPGKDLRQQLKRFIGHQGCSRPCPSVGLPPALAFHAGFGRTAELESSLLKREAQLLHERLGVRGRRPVARLADF